MRKRAHRASFRNKLFGGRLSCGDTFVKLGGPTMVLTKPPKRKDATRPARRSETQTDETASLFLRHSVSEHPRGRALTRSYDERVSRLPPGHTVGGIKYEPVFTALSV